MNSQELKEKADEYLGRAKGLITLEEDFRPVLYAVSTDNTLPVKNLKNETDEDIDEIAEIMAVMSKNSEAMILIIDTDLIDTDQIDPDEEIDPSKISEDPRMVQALVCFLHTKEESFMRQLRYISEDGKVNFCDLDWEKADTMKGKYENPYKKN